MGSGDSDNKRRDEVLGRMLRTPPAPRKPKPRKTDDEALWRPFGPHWGLLELLSQKPHI